MRRKNRNAVLCVGIAVLAAISVSAVAGASGHVAEASSKRPLLISNCAKPKFKPANVILACGDASLGATNVAWSAWTRKAAVGSGTGQLNDCNPDCARGKVKTAPMYLRASKPMTCSSGSRIFTKLSYTWTSGPPVGNVPDHGSVPVGCKLAAL
ncbi:MAG: hypothetical protein QOD14_1398 [Solirubrobacterales bacterium]|jgi:hypothetical protein|nr:hypothetical protein [Solirubrobacterales bacterium]